jgi:hypothetical protein
VIRGPPRNTQSEHQSEFNNDYPSFEQDTYGYTDQKKNFERSLKSIGEDGTWIVQPQGERNPGESTANLWGDDYLDEDSDKNPDTFYPIPYVSARTFHSLLTCNRNSFSYIGTLRTNTTIFQMHLGTFHCSSKTFRTT